MKRICASVAEDRSPKAERGSKSSASGGLHLGNIFHHCFPCVHALFAALRSECILQRCVCRMDKQLQYGGLVLRLQTSTVVWTELLRQVMPATQLRGRLQPPSRSLRIVRGTSLLDQLLDQQIVHPRIWLRIHRITSSGKKRQEQAAAAFTTLSMPHLPNTKTPSPVYTTQPPTHVQAPEAYTIE